MTEITEKKLSGILLPKDKQITILFFMIFLSLITNMHVYAHGLSPHSILLHLAV